MVQEAQTRHELYRAIREVQAKLERASRDSDWKSLEELEEERNYLIDLYVGWA